MRGVRIAVVALVLACAGCLPGLHTVDESAELNGKSYDQAVAGWLNNSVSNLISTWGQPTTVSTLPDGDSLYEWDDVDHTHVDASQAQLLTFMQRRSRSSCTTLFTVDGKQNIIKYSWHVTYTGYDYGCQ